MWYIKQLPMDQRFSNKEIHKVDVKERYRLLSLPTSDYDECQLPFITETVKAICFDACRASIGEDPVWVPKSQMEILEMGESGTRYFIKKWFIQQNKKL